MNYPLLARHFLRFLRSQWWSHERRGDFQDRLLKQIIMHSATFVPYYRDLFRRIGLDPRTFRGRADMTRIPTLDKQAVRTHREDFMAENAQRYGIHPVSTSGTTGTPLHLVLDDSADAAFLASLVRCYRWSGYRFFKRTFSLQSYYFPDRDLEFKSLYNVLRFDSVRLSRASAVNAAATLNHLKPSFFMGFPFDLAMFARFCREEGVALHQPASILCYGETLSDTRRAELHEAFQCPVFNFYSHHESVIMGADCPHHSFHLVDDFCFPEVVDAEGNPVAPGDTGELIGTGFYNYAMPLIRYRTGDKVKLPASSTPCSCGRSFPVVENLRGKQCDYLETPDGRVLSTVMSHSMDHAKGVSMSQCVQDAIDHIEVRIIADPDYTPESEAALLNGIRKRLGDGMRIDVRRVDQLEKAPSGKTPFLLSKIGNRYE